MFSSKAFDSTAGITVFASASRVTNVSLLNKVNTMEAMNDCKVFAKYQTVLPCIGSYKEEGQQTANLEESMYFETTSSCIPAIKELFFNDFEQDSILVVCNLTRQTNLLLNNGEVLHLGIFQPITREEALKSECFTYVKSKGYFLAK